MHEDDVYRTSTQYRLWSFTSPALEALRANTNTLASDRVRIAIKRARVARSSKSASENGSGATSEAESNRNGGDTEQEVDCLTVQEEQKIVGHYINVTFSIAKSMDVPIQVTGTAIQFLKRFYLYNSPMTYHPKKIMPCALFLATKTENWHIPLDTYVKELVDKAKIKDMTRDSVLAVEYILTQGLRFTFDVRHPQRALKGGYLELVSLAEGTGLPIPDAEQTSDSLQKEMLALPEHPGDVPSASTSPSSLRTRINNAYGRAKDTLATSALTSDVYFHYTPSQTFLSALFLADEVLATFYLTTKVPPSSPQHLKILSVLRICAAMLAPAPPFDRAELKRIDKKLYACQNPDKMDLVALNKAHKRDGAVDGQLEENVAKKRKLERDNGTKEGEALFGPSLGRGGDVGSKIG